MVFWFKKFKGYFLILRLMSILEGFFCGEREYFLKGIIFRLLSILRLKGFYLFCVWEIYGGYFWGEMYIFS